MTGFYSGGFYPGGFYAAALPDIPSAVSRAVAEFLGTFLEARVSRSTAEVLSAPELWKAEVSRIAVEQMGEVIPNAGHLVRSVVEVLGDTAYSVPIPQSTIQRAAVELLGTMAGTLGKDTTVARAVAEVLGSVFEQHRGMVLPAIPATMATLLLAVTVDTTTAGSWALSDAEGDGFYLHWGAGETEAIVGYRFNGTVSEVNTSITTPMLLRIEAPANPVQLTRLGMVRTEANSAKVHELLLFDRHLTSTLAAQYTAYLSRKWVSGLADPGTPCTELPPAGDHMYTVIPGTFSPYVGYLDPLNTGGTTIGSYTPLDGNLFAAASASSAGASLFALLLDTAEPLTQARVIAGGNEYIVPGSVTAGSDFGLPNPFILICQAGFAIPEIADGIPFTVSFE